MRRPTRRSRKFVLLVAAALFVAVIASCAHQPSPLSEGVPGFFKGLLHGFLILFSFIGSIFTDVRIYAFPNAGGWYDFGYLIGAGLFLGGAGAS
jgi:RsiW-degrading membrane proteinase PrsW (M82 family)